MRFIVSSISAIFLISFCFAQCNSGQIDINSASLSDLDKLIGIGPAYAQGIIDGRPYSLIDELDKVKGIGPKTLEKIKSQGLACIGSGTSVKTTTSSTEEITEESSEVDGQENEVYSTPTVTAHVIEESISEQQITIEMEQTENIINLNSDIKTTEEKIVYESRSEQIRKYSIYVFVIFLLVVAIFLLLEKHERAKDYSNDDY